jgi:branched-chain amino acid transport system permease protein
MSAYIHELIALVAVFAVASLSLNLIVERAGLFSMMHGALIAFGAYSYALSTTNLGFWPSAGILVAIAASSVAGLIAAFCSVRLDEEQFAVTTLALQLLVINILSNWVDLTKGPYGIAQVPTIAIWGTESRETSFLITALLAVLVCATAFWLIAKSRFGLLLKASSIQEHMVEALGCPVSRYRIYAFCLGSVAAGLTGAIYAMHAGYIAPQLFEIHLSILILAMVIVGGGSIVGAIGGAAVIILIPEMLRFVAFDAAATGPLRQILFGCLLIGVIFARAKQGQRRRTSA